MGVLVPGGRFMMRNCCALVLFSLIAACSAGDGPLMGTPVGRGLGTGGAAGGGAGAGSAGSGGASGGGALPCEVAAVLQAKCQFCHGTTPQFGAPSPLVTYADMQATARTMPSLAVWQTMQRYVHRTAPVTHMPPASQPALSPSELATLDAWF